MLRRARPLLGTLVDIQVDGLDNTAAREAVEAAFGEIADVHRLMSFHEAASELSRLNRDAWRTSVHVDARTAEVIALALEFARLSEGRFDPTVAADLVAAKFLPRPMDAPEPSEQASWRDIEIAGDRRVRFARRLWIDLGGIAKGYAVDRAIECLAARGASSATVNAGGDLRRFGEGSDAVCVRDPGNPQSLIPILRLGEGAVATSGSYFSARDGRGPYLDGATRRLLDVRRSVTVLAERCADADALTKIVLADAVAAERVLTAKRAEAMCLADGRSTRMGRAA